MTTLSKEDVVQLIEDLGAGSNWLSGNHNVYSYNRQPKIAAMFLKAFAEQGLLELIAELRKPHDWKLEGFGHFKDAKTSPSDAPFRAADALEHFVNSARADLVAENDRLDATWYALAATQAREIVGTRETKYSLNSEIRELCCPPPADDSALREMIAGVYEECASWYANEGWLLDEDDVSDAIRALAEKARPGN